MELTNSHSHCLRSKADSQARSQLDGKNCPGSVRQASELTADLTNDHKLIVQNLAQLMGRERKLKAGRRFTDTTALNRLERTLTKHFKKEEQLLYPLIKRSLGSAICNKLRTENSEIMNLTKRSTRKQLPPKSFSRLTQLLHAHISTEENVLFWYLEVQQQP